MAILLTKGRRVAALCSALWLIITFVISINAADNSAVRNLRRGQPNFDSTEFISMFVVFGILPVLLLWGIIWIRSAPTKDRSD